jgi:sulfate adenylyltransferase subunit 1
MTVPAQSLEFSIEEFLRRERSKDLLRFSTAGSVDDGKSTLIGRLLYDTQSVYEDQVSSIQGKGTAAPGEIDFALLTDGLRAEREQGITIDVAYRYFSTIKRKYIVADTPGHEQYTRNMATGASTADAAVVLIDARKGVLPQSRRHAYIAALLGVRQIVVAVNKMDLTGYDESVFRAIERDFGNVLENIANDTGRAAKAVFLPVSALGGDNVVHRSNAMPWYGGPSLLELLESLPSTIDLRDGSFRFPVQRVLRPHQGFRGFAGQIASGSVRPGDRIVVLPSGRGATVTRIVTYDGDLETAAAPLSVTLALDEELDISRGDLVVSQDCPVTVSPAFTAALVWMDGRPLEPTRKYLLKHTSQVVPVISINVQWRTNIATLAHEPSHTLKMNDIGVAGIRLSRPIALDRYLENRSLGGFILIDPTTNSTVAAGMVETILTPGTAIGGNEVSPHPVTAEERAALWGHRGAILRLIGPSDRVDRIERSLFQSRAITTRSIDLQHATAMAEAGVIALLVEKTEDSSLRAEVEGQHIMLDEDEDDVAAVEEMLRRTGVTLLPRSEKR